jgi:hypothetical protein
MRREQIALALRLFAWSDRPVTPALAGEVLHAFERAEMGGAARGADGLSQAERDALVATAAGWSAEQTAELLRCDAAAVRVTLVSSIEKLARSLGSDDDPFGSGDRAPSPHPHHPPTLKAARPQPADEEEQSESGAGAAFSGERGFEAL